MLFARFLAENNLLVEPTSGVAITMTECEELAREQGEDPWATASRFAERMLPQIFQNGNPVFEITMPPETRQTLERLLMELPSEVFTADDSLGWTYQFWQSAEKERVNNRAKSGEKITGRTLPAVTQLFTEHYMVLFLLHNTIGAWHAGNVLAARPELANTYISEQELREAVALGDYSFDYLRFVREPAVEKDTGEKNGPWRPAAGTFDAWPRQARDLKVLDPCCGSGHFLIAALDLLVSLRMAEEGLSLVDAIQAVLAENLFGLELDARCTQIAAFNLALAAWKIVGRVIDLPALNIACSGLAVGVPKSEWLKLAGDDIRLRNGMEQLYNLFEQATEVGSLIDPRHATSGGELFSAEFSELQPLLQQALHRNEVATSDEQREVCVAAQGIAKSAELLADRYHLVITNVPYLTRGKQNENLKDFCETNHSEAKNDLATVFLDRCLEFCYEGGTTSIVLPQNWLFLTSYKKFRGKLLKNDTFHLIARLGPHAFQTPMWDFNVQLLSISRGPKRKDRGTNNLISGIDASEPRQPAEKDKLLCTGEIKQVEQPKQLENPDARVALEKADIKNLLGAYSKSLVGIQTGDDPRYILAHWELKTLKDDTWKPFQSTPKTFKQFDGGNWVIRWEHGTGSLSQSNGARIQGLEAIGKSGILLHRMSEIFAYHYQKSYYHQNVAVIVPHNPEHLPAIWCFCSSPEYNEAVRRIDQKLNVTNATLVKVPFDLEHWQGVATEKYPDGLPKPYSDDPTQWIFHGHPAASQLPLQVAVARLLGYHWPAEMDADMELSDEARELVNKCSGLLPYADADGIVCLSPVRDEGFAADRLRRLLAAAFSSDWSATKERQLLEAAAGDGRPAASLEEWLRDKFFEEHCRLFHHRPFVWHIWDGRSDGFNALVNYHRLAGPDGEGRRTLEALTYTYLGDWIERQKAAQNEGKEGADARLAAALDLQEQLERILEGEPPYDIFVRWKPLHKQPIGWEPDINDGVRINIRPFMSATLSRGGRAGAGILRWKPNIKWGKDRGKEPLSLRPRDDFPWFWGCDPEKRSDHRINFPSGQKFNGNRWNDLHYSNAVKQAARGRSAKVVTL